MNFNEIQKHRSIGPIEISLNEIEAFQLNKISFYLKALKRQKINFNLFQLFNSFTSNAEHGLGGQLIAARNHRASPEDRKWRESRESRIERDSHRLDREMIKQVNKHVGERSFLRSRILPHRRALQTLKYELCMGHF